MASLPPQDFLALKALISEKYESLSKRLKQVATFIQEHPNAVALETLASIGRQAEVPPSTLVRFANALGYSGFGEIQQIFRNNIASNSPSYMERVRGLVPPVASDSSSHDSILMQMVQNDRLALEYLVENIASESIEQAVHLLAEANNVYVVGLRRSFPIANYLLYALRKLQIRTHIVDGSGGTLKEQTEQIVQQDVLWAIAFNPYAEETQLAVRNASQQGAKVLLISDSPYCPMVEKSDLFFEVKSAESHGFRSLTTPLCLAQSIVVSLAFHLEAKPLSPSKSMLF